MKKLILGMLALGLVCLDVKAQSTNVISGFFGDALTWATSFNTNLTWTNSTIELYSGTANYNNESIEAIFGARVNPWKGLALGPEIHNISDLGTVSQAGGFVGWGFSHYDLRLTPELAMYYRADTKHAGLSPGLVLEKQMTANTAAGIRLDFPIDLHRDSSFSPTVSVWATVIAW